MEATNAPRATCPWRDTELCPRNPTVGHGSTAALTVRVDLDQAQARVCACRDPLPSTDRRSVGPELRKFPSESPILIPPEDAEGLLRHFRAQWVALRSLLKDPMQGLAALGLGVLPNSTQDLIVDSLDRGVPVVLRVNLGPDRFESPPLPLIGLRALGSTSPIRLEVRELKERSRSPLGSARRRLRAVSAPRLSRTSLDGTAPVDEGGARA